MEKRETITSIVILAVGLTGVILFLLLSEHPPLPLITSLSFWSFLICRMFTRQNRLLGILMILAALTLLFNTSQTPSLFLLATGLFLNGLIIMVNKGMPVQGLKFSDGVHIPMDGAKLTFLGDLSVLGKWSVGDLFLISFSWFHLLLFYLS